MSKINYSVTAKEQQKHEISPMNCIKVKKKKRERDFYLKTVNSNIKILSYLNGE